MDNHMVYGSQYQRVNAPEVDFIAWEAAKEYYDFMDRAGGSIPDLAKTIQGARKRSTALDKVDWKLLHQQKLALVAQQMTTFSSEVEGVINLLDALEDEHEEQVKE